MPETITKSALLSARAEVDDRWFLLCFERERLPFVRSRDDVVLAERDPRAIRAGVVDERHHAVRLGDVRDRLDEDRVVLLEELEVRRERVVGPPLDAGR